MYTSVCVCVCMNDGVFAVVVLSPKKGNWFLIDFMSRVELCIHSNQSIYFYILSIYSEALKKTSFSSILFHP